MAHRSVTSFVSHLASNDRFQRSPSKVERSPGEIAGFKDPVGHRPIAQEGAVDLEKQGKATGRGETNGGYQNISVFSARKRGKHQCPALCSEEILSDPPARTICYDRALCWLPRLLFNVSNVDHVRTWRSPRRPRRGSVSGAVRQRVLDQSRHAPNTFV